ncbi:MAG TPA: diaminopimelate decarboxylase, partial [Limnochordales bacterium]
VLAGGHKAMQTGHSHSKFGIPIEDGQAREAVRRILSSPWLELRGYHVHIGSQIFSVQPFREAARVVADFAAAMHRELGAACPEVDMGGGLGARYVAGDSPATVEELVSGVGQELAAAFSGAGLPVPFLWLEPGRSVVAEAGLAVYTLGAPKRLPGGEELVAVDGGMSDNPRVALYQARYTAVLAARPLPQPDQLRRVRIVGRLCESGDVLCEEAWLGPYRSGDILAVLTAGAYHLPMSSNYNGVGRPAVVAVRHGRETVWVRRETYEDQVARDELLATARSAAAAAGQGA